LAKKGQRKKRLGKERLQHVIDLCKSVEERGLNPFIVEVDDIIEVVQEHFPEWELPEELCLDAEAIHQLSSVIKLQSDWVRHRSTSLYTDPFLLEEKIRQLNKEEVVNIFLEAWKPIVELEQITPYSLTQAIKYWRDLLPLSERWQISSPLKIETGTVTREELVEQRILSNKVFSEELEALWKDLKQSVDEEGRIRYWDFIGADTYSKTIDRAYMTSFLVTYGYAILEIYRLKEEIYIKPLKKPKPLIEMKHEISFPISISVEEWMKWKESKQD
jgi:hypothetical protein